MRIVCPSCHAAYEVPASVVAAGRTMRCAKCGAEFPALTADEPDASALPETMPDSPPLSSAPPPLAPAPSLAMPVGNVRVPDSGRLVPPPSQATGGRAGVVLAAWALSLGVLAAGGWSALIWRDRIMHVWPPSTRLYAALGYER